MCFHEASVNICAKKHPLKIAMTKQFDAVLQGATILACWEAEVFQWQGFVCMER